MTSPVSSPSPRRICFVAPFGLRLKGTVRARILPLAKVLAQHGNEVMVLIPPWDSPEDAGKSWLDEGIRIVNVAVTGGLPLILARMVGEIRRFGPDILHIVKPRAHAGLIQWLIWHVRSLAGRPDLRIFLDVDDWEQAWEGVADYSWPMARFLAWQEAWGIRHADSITAASRWLESRANAYAPKIPVLYLPNGVPVPDEAIPPHQPTPSHAPTVLLFSRFVEVDPVWMGDFWAALQAKVPGVRFVVAGEGIQPRHGWAMHKTLTARSNLAGTSELTWLGYVDAPTLAAAVAEADCAIFPAADVPLNQAKCSVRLATTLMAGLPVVASAVGEQANYGGGGAARMVGADASPADFAQAVADLLAVPQDRVALAAQARRHLIEKYDWEKLGEKLDEFYA